MAKLVYKKGPKKGEEVKVGDRTPYGEVTYFRPPHSPASSGKVSVRPDGATTDNEFYVSVIDAEWIEREDR